MHYKTEMPDLGYGGSFKGAALLGLWWPMASFCYPEESSNRMRLEWFIAYFQEVWWFAVREKKTIFIGSLIFKYSVDFQADFHPKTRRINECTYIFPSAQMITFANESIKWYSKQQQKKSLFQNLSRGVRKCAYFSSMISIMPGRWASYQHHHQQFSTYIFMNVKHMHITVENSPQRQRVKCTMLSAKSTNFESRAQIIGNDFRWSAQIRSDHAVQARGTNFGEWLMGDCASTMVMMVQFGQNAQIESAHGHCRFFTWERNWCCYQRQFWGEHLGSAIQ